MDDLKVMFPENKVTLTTGEVIEVKAFTFGQLPKAISLSKDLFGVARQLYQNEVDSAELIGDMFASGGENFIELISMSTSKPREWFNSLAADDGLNLATVFLEVNLSFFAQKVLPAFTTGMGRLQKAVPGLTQS
jgi:hypothetical protein